MTHDLFVGVLGELGSALEQVVVTDLKDRTFYAELHLRHGEEAVIVSSRPSDAIALAVRTGSPVFVAETVLDEAGVAAATILGAEDGEEPEVETEGDGDPDQVVEEFRAFIDQVRPEDFE